MKQEEIAHNKTISSLYLIQALFFLCFLFNSQFINSQTLTQNIQIVVTDAFTGENLPGAYLTLNKDSLIQQAVTNEHGSYTFRDLPLGKYQLEVRYTGYEKERLTQLNLSSGKALSIEVALHESAQEIETVDVNAWADKHAARNSMALTGSRSFTPDETTRYAGSYGDPARMAMNYAGVLPVRDNRNDIIVRGNSAFGLQWRIEGIEIPNPNHFGASATTGGPITIINSNLLSKSDFFNGAFPAEYGNAVAGVFDLKLRASNPQKREHYVQLGWNGLEFGTEGPFVKGNQATYLIAYRHSVTDIAYQLGADPKNRIAYKDLSFKFNFPSKKIGYFSLIGMGGNSLILLDERRYARDELLFESYGEITDNQTSAGMLGLVHKIYPGKNTGIITTLSATANTVKNQLDTFNLQNETAVLWASEDTKEISLDAETKLKRKTSYGADISLGAEWQHYILSYQDMENINGQKRFYTDTTGVHTDFTRAWAEHKYTFGISWQTYAGLHAQYFFLNKSYSVEPRLAVKYRINRRSDLTYGFGLHSQLQPRVSYFVQTAVGDNFLYTNQNLDFTKSMHHILSYNLLINKNLLFKAESYYQQLYNVPVSQTEPAYSLINFSAEYHIERKDSLINEGSGQNYGLELTLEHYFRDNFFWLVTLSLFESNYTGADGIQRNTAYNGHYALNAVGGYEFNFPKKGAAFILGINLTYAGGSPYLPYDSYLTQQQGRVMYDYANAYKVYREDYQRASLRIGVRRNFKKFSLQTSADLQYRTAYTNIYVQRIDIKTGQVYDTNALAFYPMITSRIDF